MSAIPLASTNAKANKTFHLKEKSHYNTQPGVSFFTVAYYSFNKAMLFYVGANVYMAYYLSKQDATRMERYWEMGVMLLLTQIVYNWLDLNSKNNIERLEAMS